MTRKDCHYVWKNAILTYMYFQRISILSGIRMVYWLLRSTFLQKENFNVLDRTSERMVGRWVLVSRPSRPKMSAKEYAFVKCDVTRDCSYIEICLSSKPTGLHDSAQIKFSQISLNSWKLDLLNKRKIEVLKYNSARQ